MKRLVVLVGAVVALLLLELPTVLVGGVVMRRYPWSCRRFWWAWLSQDIRAGWYRARWGIRRDQCDGGSMLPELGRGQFVSVYRRGSYLDIIAHGDAPGAPRGTIRLVPFQPNHGVMVEHWQDGRLRWRITMDYRAFVRAYAADISSRREGGSG